VVARQVRRFAGRKAGLFRASVDRVTELEAHIDNLRAASRTTTAHLPTHPVAAHYRCDPIVDDFILDTKEPGTILRLLGSGIPATERVEPPVSATPIGLAAGHDALKGGSPRNSSGARPHDRLHFARLHFPRSALGWADAGWCRAFASTTPQRSCSHGVLLGVVNAIIRPIAIILTLPLTI